MGKLLDRPATSAAREPEPSLRDDLERHYQEMVDRWPKDRVEIVDARITVRPVPSFDHARVVGRLLRLIMQLVVERGWEYCPELSVFLGTQRDRYRPDLAITIAEPRLWGTDHVYGRDTRLVVEVVSPDSARDDHEIKPEGYAGGGVPLCMVVDTFRGTVRLLSEPGDDGYARQVEVKLGEPLELPEPWGVPLDTAQLLDA